MINKQIIWLTIGFFCSAMAVSAQNALPAAGGMSTGKDGSVSYSVGQTFYLTDADTSGTVTEGVQQPYEILVGTGIEEAKDILLECIAFPNPASTALKLKIKNFLISDLFYQLFDPNGKQIDKRKIVENENTIPVEHLVPGTYFLTVTRKNREVKSFKIIKN